MHPEPDEEPPKFICEFCFVIYQSATALSAPQERQTPVSLKCKLVIANDSIGIATNFWILPPITWKSVAHCVSNLLQYLHYLILV